MAQNPHENQENEQSSMSVNLRLTEKLTEKIIMIPLSFLLSFGAGVIYADNQTPALPTNCPLEQIR